MIKIWKVKFNFTPANFQPIRFPRFFFNSRNVENRTKKNKTYIKNALTPNLDNVAFFTDSRIEILAVIETGGQTATKEYYSEKFHENFFV